MGKFRDGMPVTAEAVTLILSTIDRIKSILEAIEKSEQEPEGGDGDLIDLLGRMARQEAAAPPRQHLSRSNLTSPSRSRKPKNKRRLRPSDLRKTAATGSPTIRSASMSIRLII